MNNNRWVLILLFLLFLTPILVAVFLNSQWTDYRPEASKNHGRLIDPVQPLDAGLRTAAGIDTDISTFTGRWWLLHYAPGDCAEACLHQLRQLQQIQQAMGRDQSKVGVALISGDTLPLEQARQVHSVSENILQLADYHGQAGAIFSAIHPAGRAVRANFLLDPLANLAITYAPESDPSGIRKDLKRLVGHTNME